MSSLKFHVYEDGRMFSVSEMTEPESAAISECLDALLPKPKSDSYWFEPDLCLFNEEVEDPPYGLIQCYAPNPTPKDGSTLESRIPHALPDELKALSGKTFQVRPRQFGLSPWGKVVEIVFETLA